MSVLSVELTASSDEQRARGSMLNRQPAKEAWAVVEVAETRMQLQDLSFRSVVLSAFPARAIGADEAVLRGFLELLKKP